MSKTEGNWLAAKLG